ncbi:hypothetical protein ACIBP4_21960 [Micromonospora maritima]|uniref:Lipoprotein n=1 Tax=Micromonospora maritima TaxID=986711 RepID=A0ABW7ZQ43_9ACTN
MLVVLIAGCGEVGEPKNASAPPVDRQAVCAPAQQAVRDTERLMGRAVGGVNSAERDRFTDEVRAMAERLRTVATADSELDAVLDRHADEILKAAPVLANGGLSAVADLDTEALAAAEKQLKQLCAGEEAQAGGSPGAEAQAALTTACAALAKVDDGPGARADKLWSSVRAAGAAEGRTERELRSAWEEVASGYGEQYAEISINIDELRQFRSAVFQVSASRENAAAMLAEPDGVTKVAAYLDKAEVRAFEQTVRDGCR